MNSLDPGILGKLLLIQSTLHITTDNKSLTDFICRGLSEIPGIEAIGTCLHGRFYTGTLPLLREDMEDVRKKCLDCRAIVAPTGAGLVPACHVSGRAPLISIELRTPCDLYGFLLIQKGVEAEYALYEPYVRNTANLLALVMENRQQRNDLINIQGKLELAVQERTQALAESEAKYAAVMKQASEGIYLLDPDTKQILEFNDSFANMIGRPGGKAQELIVYDFVAHPKDEIDRIVKNVVSCGSYFVGERKYRRSNGALIDIEASAKLIRFGGKEVLCVIARDISERKRNEQEHERLEERLRQAQKMEAIGTLAGGIAHDFNNILSAIIGYSELVKMNLPSASQAVRDINEIVKSGMRAADLVKQILAFSRKTDRTLQIIEPNRIVKDAVKMLRATFPATVTLEEDIDERCGHVLVDPTGLHQIVLNLCTNAFQALPSQKGTIQVSLFRENGTDKQRKLQEKPAVVLTVSDSGCGMDKDTMDRVFEPYFTTKAMGKGTGLGLAVVHGIVHDYNGRITVDSTPGQGSTFTVYIPISEKQPVETKKSEKKTGTVLVPWVKPKRILFVDDEPALCTLCERHLKNSGFQVTATTDSREALEKVRSQPDRFDLLITDQTMPNFTGIELAKEALSVNPMLPIIMCSGHSDVVSEEDALALGIKRYLFKPFAKEELLRTINEVVEEQEKKELKELKELQQLKQ